MERFLRLLNVRTHEWHLVRQMFIVQFFLVIGTSFLFISADALFLSKYPIIELPKAFFLTGIFLLFFNRIYSLIEHKVSTRKLLFIVIFFTICLTVLMRIGFMFPQLSWMPYVLMIGYNIIYMLTALIFWGVAAMLFNVRESKRLFTIIGAGDLPAKLLGYLLVPVLGEYMGIENTIWIAIASFVIAIPFAWRMFNMSQVHALNQKHHEQKNIMAEKGKQTIKKIFGSDLILTISILSLITFAAIILIDYTFLAKVQEKYHTDIELASFLGVFFGAGRILAVILKFTLSSRLIERMGLVWSLLISPVSLLIFVVVILSIVNVDNSLKHYIYLIGLMALLTEILKSIIQEPVFLVLFQPLKQSLRLKGHVIAKGYMLSLSMIIVGGGLYWYLTGAGSLSVRVFSYGLVSLLILWIASIFLVKKEYLITLYEAIKRGIFRGNELYLKDKPIRDLLQKKTESKKPLEVVNALELLCREKQENVPELLCSQLGKENPLILKYAVSKLGELKYRNALHPIKQLLIHGDEEIRPVCIQTISRLEDDDLHELEVFMNGDNEECQRAAISGLLKGNDLEPFVRAGQKLLQLSESAKVSDRILAADIIRETEERKFHKMVRRLMNDKDVQVQKMAIAAAGSIRYEPDLGSLVSKLNDKNLVNEVMDSLIKFGDVVLDFFRNEMNSDLQFLAQFIQVAGGIGSEKAREFLVHYFFNAPAFRTDVTEQLWKNKYILPLSKKQSLLKVVYVELKQAGELMNKMHIILGKKYLYDLSHALQLEVDARIGISLKILGFFYERNKINDTLYAMTTEDPHKISNALEMLQMMLPRDIFKKLNLIIEEKLHPGSKLFHDQGPASPNNVVQEILESPIGIYNNWTQAVAINSIIHLMDHSLFSFLKKSIYPDDAPAILVETRRFVMSHEMTSP